MSSRRTIVCLVTLLALVLTVETHADDLEAHRRFAQNTKGDAARGKAVFEGDKAKCSACHGIGAEQRKAGPDLLGIAGCAQRIPLYGERVR